MSLHLPISPDTKLLSGHDAPELLVHRAWLIDSRSKGSNTFLKYDSFRRPYLFVQLDSRKGLTQLRVRGPIAVVCLRTSNSWNVESVVIKPGMSQVNWDKLFTIVG